MAIYHQSYDLGATTIAFQTELTQRHEEYESEEDYQGDLERGILMIQSYYDTWSLTDPERYEILELEKQHEIWIGPEEEFRVTIRPDRVIRDLETHQIYPCEVKTTGWSIPGMFSKTEDSDQITAYIWALNKVHPEWEVDRCLIDVLYNRGKVFKCDRPGFAVRSKGELTLFEMEMYGTILEFTQKVKTLEKVPWPLLFRCNKDSCAQWGCEYKPICRTNLRPDEIPPMYERDDWHQEMEEDLQLQKDFQLKEWK